jgi:signal transduction histidine kinase/CheY-like chemotaxis protein
MDSANTTRAERVVLILARFGRDAALASAALRGIASPRVCMTAEEVSKELASSAAALIAEEALDREGVRVLSAALRRQATWSDFPFIVLTSHAPTAGENRRTMTALADLGNVTTLERPVHPLTLLSAVRAALRARERQYRSRELVIQLQEALHQRDAFLAMLGHELRNPLGAISNAVQLAARSRDPSAPPDRALTIIQRQVQVLSRLVNDLLDVSRITSGKVALQREPVDLAALLERLVAQANVEARERQLHLSLSSEHEPVVVSGDAVRLEQIFNNLLSNALKYTPKRGRIEVAIRRESDSVIVSVLDSGVGIPPDALPRIFDLFAQAETSLDRAQGGMGIGLTLVRSLAQLHGGSASARSDGVGKGSEFSVTLPLMKPSHETPEPKPADSGSDGRGRHVLVVEDNHDNRATLRELLEFAGHRVSVAQTGIEGVALALERRPDVALVDIGLPGLDGYEVARRVRAAVGVDMVLIALTGYGQPEDVRRAKAAGFDAHLAKPLDLDTLQSLVARTRIPG